MCDASLSRGHRFNSDHIFLVIVSWAFQRCVTQDLGCGSYYMENALPTELLVRVVAYLSGAIMAVRNYNYRATKLKRVLKREYFEPGPGGEIPIYRWGQHVNEYDSGTEIQGVMKELLDYTNDMVNASHNHIIVSRYNDGSEHHVPPHKDKQDGVNGAGAKDMIAGTSFDVFSFGTPRRFEISDDNGEVLWAKPLAHGSLVHVTAETNKREKHGVPKDRGWEQGELGPRISVIFRTVTTWPKQQLQSKLGRAIITDRTTDLGSAPVYSTREISPIGDGGCFARALFALGTGITPGLLNNCAKGLFAQGGEYSHISETGTTERYYLEDSHWPPKAALLAFKEIKKADGKKFKFKKLKGDDLLDANLLRRLKSKGRFIVDGILNQSFELGKKRIQLHDENDDSLNRHCVAIENGKLVDAAYLKFRPGVQSALHIGPAIKAKGFLKKILKVYEL